jgi:hypothetical protein
MVYTARVLNATLLLHVFCYGCERDDRFISQINNHVYVTGLSTAVSCTGSMAHFKKFYRLRRKRPRYVTRRACEFVCIIEDVITWAAFETRRNRYVMSAGLFCRARNERKDPGVVLNGTKRVYASPLPSFGKLRELTKEKKTHDGSVYGSFCIVLTDTVHCIPRLDSRPQVL